MSRFNNESLPNNTKKFYNNNLYPIKSNTFLLIFFYIDISEGYFGHFQIIKIPHTKVSFQ